MPALLRKLVDFLCGKLLATLAPFIGAGLDIAKGIANTVDSSITKYREWVQGRDVQLLAGHPGTIVEAIRRAMKLSIGSGVYDIVKGGASLGLQFASQGASTIIDAVVSIMETLAKVIWKIVEIKRIKRFCEQAKGYWDARMQRDALHTRPIAFNGWFKRYAVPIPALSVLALNSGICGDKMHFLAMFKDDENIVTQAEFTAGCKYVDEPQGLGIGLSERCGLRVQFRRRDDQGTAHARREPHGRADLGPESAQGRARLSERLAPSRMK